MRQRFFVKEKDLLDEVVDLLSRAQIPVIQRQERYFTIEWPQHGNEEHFWHRVGVYLRAWARKRGRDSLELVD